MEACYYMEESDMAPYSDMAAYSDMAVYFISGFREVKIWAQD